MRQPSWIGLNPDAGLDMRLFKEEFKEFLSQPTSTLTKIHTELGAYGSVVIRTPVKPYMEWLIATSRRAGPNWNR